MTCPVGRCALRALRALLLLLLPVGMESGVAAAMPGGQTPGAVDGVGLHELPDLLQGDVRLLVLGDSFSAPYYSRVFPSMLKTWPIERISAIAGGGGASSDLVHGLQIANPTALVQSMDESGYKVMRSSPGDRFFALPLYGMRELYTDDMFMVGPQHRLYEIRLNNNLLENGLYGAFSVPGDDVWMRMLYWCPQRRTEMLDTVYLEDLDVVRSGVRLRAGARKLWHEGEVPDGQGRQAIPLQVNAAANDIQSIRELDGRLRVRIREHGSCIGLNQYLFPAGGVYYHRIPGSEKRQPGLYYSSLADSSWSYFGFGSDEEATWSHDKRFSRAQFTHWLDVTTLDRDQPLVVAYYLAAEEVSEVNARGLMEAMIDQTAMAAEQVGITTVQHLLVIPHLHFIGNNNEDVSRSLLENQRDAAFSLAEGRIDVSSISLYDLTEGMLFNGSPASKQWLALNGYDQFDYAGATIDLTGPPYHGRLLDLYNLHPWDEIAAAFFSTVLGEAIDAALCPADLNGDAVVGFSDLLLIFATWGPCEDECSADLDEDGVVDLDDLLLFLVAWNDC